jgi:hypothetical protein
MLKIRAEQMTRLLAVMQEASCERMVQRLRANYPKDMKDRTDEELLALARECMDLCATYGITIEADVGRYFEYAAHYGCPFEEREGLTWAAAILNNSSLDGTAKMDAIDAEHTRQHNLLYNPD